MIANGTKFGHYEIRSQIGAGGMGEVYLAEDSQLERLVALKLLPSEVASNQERMRRFAQEAKAAAALNHPNIAHIYEIGEVEGISFIAMEYVEGVSLRDKIHRERVDLRTLLKYLGQVADGLTKAHAAGIVHRDLKPDNIMVSRDGYAKILDFGLAKLIRSETVLPQADGFNDDNGSNEAATAILPQPLSTPGMIMGTIGYMSPEQAQGRREIDGRSDIFSFGCVLYEATTRQRPFDGDSVVDSLHKIIHAPAPPIRDLNPDAPHELQRIVRRCLAKDAEERYQTIKDVAIELKELRREMTTEAELHYSTSPTSENLPDKTNSLASSTTEQAAGDIHSTSSAEYIAGNIQKHKAGALVALALFVIALAGIGYGVYRLTAKEDKPEISLQAAKITRLTTTGKASGVAISPDGKYVVHVQNDGGQQTLWIRQVATQSNVPIVAPTAVGYYGMTFSPDGDYIYYIVYSQDFPQHALFHVPTLGGTPKKLLENMEPFPIALSRDGKQFAFIRVAQGKESALMIANADGTQERKLVAVNNPPEAIVAPAWSPDGKTIAYAVLNFDSNDSTIFEAQVADGSTKSLTAQRWLRITGLAWMSDGNNLLMRATAGQQFVYQIWHFSYPKGEARRLTNDLNDYRLSMSLTAASDTLAVVQSETESSIWIAPMGNASRARPVTSGSGKADRGSAWTPDGRIVYHSNAGGNDDIWIAGADGGNPKQLTSNARVNRSPTVSPDGRSIVFLSDRSGTPHLWRMNTDGSDQRQLTNGANGEDSPQFSPDGRWLVYRTSSGKPTVWKIPTDGGEPVQLTDKRSFSPTISPDGKLVAYIYLDENAPLRIAVAPLDGGDPLKTFAVPIISSIPLHWMPDGRALAYIDTKNDVSNIFAQPLDGSAPKQLTDFKADRIFSFDYSRDGKQLALSRGTQKSDVFLFSDFKR
ncbi:MAG: protein kinase [Acidobacteriota bacterium]|nr:protein kinase [Acidobacteriota bacterium]